MTLENLTVKGTSLSYGCDNDNPTVGVQFSDAGGAMRDVTVADITQHSACLTVHSILLRSSGEQRTVNLTRVSTPNFQRTGLLVMGKVTLHVTGSTFGPPDLTIPGPGRLAQNSVQLGSPSLAGPTTGTFTRNNLISTAFGADTNVSVALLLYGTTGLLVDHNTFSGAGTDVGINMASTTDTVVSYNHIARGAPDRPGYADPYGYGASADDTSRDSAQLICNTFAGWNLNLDNLTQPPCIEGPSHLPCAVVGKPYSHTLHATDPAAGTHLTWRVVSGHLPPGLHLNSEGTITGTATKAAITKATVEVTDSAGHTGTRTLIFCAKPAPRPPHPCRADAVGAC